MSAPRIVRRTFFCFPKAEYPLSIDELRQIIAERSESTVIELDGQIVGFANFYRWGPKRCSIGNVIVASNVRGQGVAVYLVRHMLKRAIQKYKTQEVTVSCFNQNVAGFLLYKKLGFKPYDIEQRFKQSGDSVVLIHMRSAPNPI